MRLSEQKGHPRPCDVAPILQLVHGSAGTSGPEQAAGADGLPVHNCKGKRQVQVSGVGGV